MAFGRSPKDWKNTIPSVDRDIETLFGLVSEQSVVIKQVITTDTGSITKPVEIINPDAIADKPQADDPINPTNPNAPTPKPTGVPQQLSYSAKALDYTLSNSAAGSLCFVSIPKPMVVETATITWSEGPLGSDFSGTPAACYQLDLMLAGKTDTRFCTGFLRTSVYPMYAEGTAEFPPNFINNGEVAAKSQLFIKTSPVGAPSATSNRNWVLTITGYEKLPPS